MMACKPAPSVPTAPEVKVAAAGQSSDSGMTDADIDAYVAWVRSGTAVVGPDAGPASDLSRARALAQALSERGLDVERVARIEEGASLLLLESRLGQDAGLEGRSLEARFGTQAQVFRRRGPELVEAFSTVVGLDRTGSDR